MGSHVKGTADSPKFSAPYRFLLSFVLLLVPVAGCDELVNAPDAGDSATVDLPPSIIGYKLVEKVEQGTLLEGDPAQIVILQRGETLTYQFVDGNTIVGDGLHVVPTVSWSYRRISGNQAEVTFNYDAGVTTDTLTFHTEASGEFVGYHRRFAQGPFAAAYVRYEGTFRIGGLDPEVAAMGDGGGPGGGDTGDGGPGGGGDGPAPACEQNQTGTVTFWVSWSGFDTQVDLDVSGLGSRSTRYWFDSAPACGQNQEGTMEFRDVAAGTYSFTARDRGGTQWGPGDVTVRTCRCLLFELR